MQPSIDHIFRFTDFLQKYRAIERSILIKNSDRQENDVEHSFSLAMLAWYINSTYKLGLDLEKLFMYSLAHDLVETYAGETYFYAKGPSDKHEREEAAAKKIQAEFPEFPELHNVIIGYEQRSDLESKFVYALDKIEPVLNIYVDGGRTWRKNKVTLDMLQEIKTPKVSVDKTIDNIFKEIVERLKSEHDTLFVSKE